MQEQVILSQIPLSQIEEIIKRCVNDAITAHTPTATPDESEVTFSISELADYLKVTRATIHAYKKRKIFNCYQTGRTVFFKKKEVDKALLVDNKKRATK